MEQRVTAEMQEAGPSPSRSPLGPWDSGPSSGTREPSTLPCPGQAIPAPLVKPPTASMGTTQASTSRWRKGLGPAPGEKPLPNPSPGWGLPFI